jgi:hypothetical protein
MKWKGTRNGMNAGRRAIIQQFTAVLLTLAWKISHLVPCPDAKVTINNYVKSSSVR